LSRGGLGHVGGADARRDGATRPRT
jgi:hypothetical protein